MYENTSTCGMLSVPESAYTYCVLLCLALLRSCIVYRVMFAGALQQPRHQHSRSTLCILQQRAVKWTGLMDIAAPARAVSYNSRVQHSAAGQAGGGVGSSNCIEQCRQGVVAVPLALSAAGGGGCCACVGGDAVVDVCTGYVGLAAWHSASSFVWHVVAVQSGVVSKQSLSAHDCREAQWVVSLVQEVYVR